MFGIAASLISAPVRAVAQVASPEKVIDATADATAGALRLGVRAASVGLSGAAFAAGMAKGTATVLPKMAAQAMPNGIAREAVASGRALLDTHPRRQRRRVWTGHGRAHIEVRGVDGDVSQTRRLADGVPRALRRVNGVRWAKFNAVTGQVLVAFDDRRVGVDTLLDTVRGVEKSHGARDDDFSWHQPTHPGDPTPIAATAVELAADCVATATATVEAVFRISPLPRHVRTVLAALEVERDLRRGLKRRIGPIETDLVLSLATAAVHGLSGGISTPAVDIVYRCALLAEAWARRDVWNRREPDLSGSADAVPRRAQRPPPRPGPRPRGPIETWNARLGPTAPAVAAGVLAFTRSPRRAADALQAAVPRAARYGRQGFATAVGRELARREIIPMNAAAFRRMDRISAVVVDSAVLTAPDGRLDPLADAVIDAAGATGGRVHLTDTPAVRELLSRVDDAVAQGVALADHVRELQADGHGVLVVSSTDEAALAAADVGVAVVRGDTTAYWSADLICKDSLEDAWRILRATAAARGVSERSVRLAQAGSALGVLQAFVADRRPGLTSLAPVQLAGFVALVRGTVTGLRATRAAPPVPVVRVPWHELDGREVYARLRELRTDTVGVTRPALTGRRHELSRQARALREELSDPLTPVLVFGAIASAIVGSGVDGILVGAVVTGNALVSGIQRIQVERTLREMMSTQEVQARRLSVAANHLSDEDIDRLAETDVENIPAAQLVPGDVIELRASDLVPADARLLIARDVEVDESTLTGESVPVAKDTATTPDAPLAERTGVVFEGTSVLAGTAYAVVVATGESTEAGRAARIAGRAPRPAGVQARLSEVTRIAMPVTALGGAAVTGLGLLRGLPIRDAVAAGVSVAVAAVPEGLPLVATVAQAGGARRLSKHQTLVRTSRALEALGRVDVVCFDKTGTLTEGRLRLARVASANGDVDPDEPAGRNVLTVAGRACPSVAPEEISRVPHATDRAVLEAVGDLGWEPVTELPFESRRGYFAALGHDRDGAVLAVKGTPEVVLPLCDAPPEADSALERLASDGLRVLAVAERRGDLPGDADDLEPLVKNLTLVGFIGIADVERPEAADAVRDLTDAGTRVVMVTGDHPETARAVAARTGIANGKVLTGAEIDRMTDAQRTRRIPGYTVFARVSPEHKVQIVEAMQRAEHVVAMIGDGVNDAAAIRLADVGIGVSTERATPAQSAADLVLTTADMRQVHRALIEGRGLWRRVRDAVAILVGGNAGEVAFMMLGTALAGRAPITTRQMLLVNMLTDMFPALAVALAARDDDADVGPVGSLLGAPLARSVAVRGGATALGATLAWTAGRFTGRRCRASTMGLAALVGTQLGQTLVAGRHSSLVVATSLASFAALVAAVQTPGLSQFLGCTPLGPMAWGIVVVAAAVGTVASTAVKDPSGGEAANA